MKKLLLLDMDGTVRRCKSDPSGFINDPLDQEIIPEAIAQLSAFAADGWKIVGITNQGGVAAGYKSLEDAIAEQEFTLKLAPQISCIYFCPDQGQTCIDVDRDGTEGRSTLPLGSTSYRKPSAGMLLRAMSGQRWDQVVMVGDRPEDQQAAFNAGVPFEWAGDWQLGQ